MELAVDFDDGLARALLDEVRLSLIVALAVGNGSVGDESAANDFALDDGLVGRDEIDGLAFVKGEQHLFRDGIIAVVLLEDA